MSDETDTEELPGELELAQQQLDAADQSARVEHPVKKNKDNELVVPFKGREFRIRTKISYMALAQFSKFAQISSDDERAMGALYDMLRGCIVKEDWTEFVDLAVDDDASPEELFDVINAVGEALSGRPTERPGTSQAGSGKTSRASTGKSSSKRERASRS